MLRKLGYWFVPLLALGLIFYITGTRECGNVYRSTPDKAAAIQAGDTVPAALANGDTTLYRYECVGGGFNGLALLGLAVLLGIIGLLVADWIKVRRGQDLEARNDTGSRLGPGRRGPPVHDDMDHPPRDNLGT